MSAIDTKSDAEGDERNLLIQEVDFKIGETMYNSFYIKDYFHVIAGMDLGGRAVYAHSNTSDTDYKIRTFEKITFNNNQTISEDFYNWFSTVATELENNDDVNVGGQTWVHTEEENSYGTLDGYMLQEYVSPSSDTAIIIYTKGGTPHFVQNGTDSFTREWAISFAENQKVSQRFYDWLSASATLQTD